MTLPWTRQNRHWIPSDKATSSRIVNAAGEFNASSNAELTEAYKEYGNSKEYKEYFTNITRGSNGHPCAKGWTFCTGIGSPLTLGGK